MTDHSRAVAQTLVLTVALAVFWIACVATVRAHELLVGAGAVLLSVASSLFVVRTLPLRFRPSVREIAQIWHIPSTVVIDLFQITLILARDFAAQTAPSLFRSAPWGPVRNNGEDTAKRALAITYTTVSPNCIVVGIDCKRGQILFHQLKATSVPTLTRNLGAGAGR